ncbi:barstar family protein [Actinospica robiniae]|uniref:barstar family protein n=1 Tax=Actinospica robiniae TaxID=304901 RepID=UPI0003FABD39|nr:barstar family protein [Actinospica robiniae]
MSSANLPVLTIDGSQFDDLEGFAREFSKLLCHYTWRGNLDAFNDILRGGFGTPVGGFVLRWLNSARSRHVLGWEATAAWYEQQVLPHCHPSNRQRVLDELALAKRGEGETLFDRFIEIIQAHGPGGEESDDRVVLELW